jgi:hypothetical protein
VHSENKEVTKSNQYSEIQQYTDEKYRITATNKRKTKSEKCNITSDHTVRPIY